MKKLAILAIPGVFDSSLGLTLDILRTAAAIHAGYCGGTVAVQSKTYGVGTRRIKTGAGLSLQLDATVSEAGTPDVVVVPGIGVFTLSELETLLCDRDVKRGIDFLRQARESEALLTASCTATFLLAEAGAFQNSPATTSWWLADAFRARFPNVELQSDQMLVATDRVICAGAAMAQADLMLALIARLYGEETARLTSHYLLIDRREYQSQYVLSTMLTGRHDELAAAERWVRDNMGRDFQIAELAGAVGLSKRTLDRRLNEALGVGPLKFVQRLKLEHAIHLLETTQLSLDDIAGEIGYADTSSLRRILLRQTGRTPKQLRIVRPGSSS